MGNLYTGTPDLRHRVAATPWEQFLPLPTGGLELLFGERLAAAVEPEGCGGVLEHLQGSFARLSEAARHAIDADHLAHQGWAKDFADATAELFAGIIFLRDAATIERSKVLALYTAASALRRAARVQEIVAANEKTGFDDESFESVVGPYRSGM